MQNAGQNKSSGVQTLFEKLPVKYNQRLGRKAITIQENCLGLQSEF